MNNKRKTFKQACTEVKDEEMILKKGSELTDEYKTIELLRKLWVILLLLGIIFEFIGYEIPHKDFIVNILLGASVSSFVSFITLYIPFENKKTEEKNEFNSMLRKIYVIYKRMYLSLQNCKCDYAKEYLNELVEKIEIFKSMYNKMNFRSDDFEKKAKTVTESLKNVIIDANYCIEWLNTFLDEKDLEFYGKEDYENLAKKMYSIVISYIDKYNIPNLCSYFEVLDEEIDDLKKVIYNTQKALDDNKATDRGMLIKIELDKRYSEITKELFKKKLNINENK